MLTFGKAAYFTSYSSKAVNYGDGVLLYSDIVLGKVKELSKSNINLTDIEA
jgi:hypothetical protein